MGYFFNLGSNWRCAFLALAPLISCSFAQSAWQESDVDYVRSKLNYIETYVSLSHDEILSIGADVAGIQIFLDDISHDTGDILSKLRNLSYTPNNDLRVSDTGVLHRVSSIDSKMDRIEQAINNLTNYMCYSQEYTITFNSNMMHLVTSYFGGSWPFRNGDNLGASMYDQLENMSDLIEAGDYEYLNRYYGLWKAFPTLLYSIVDYGHIPPGMFSRFRSAFNMLSLGSLVIHTNSLQQVSAPIYYQYGTRELTDSFLQYTNQILYALNQINDSLTNHLDPRFISTSTSDSGTSYGFTDAAGNVARGMSESATQLFSIEDDITQVDTNPIVAISDSGYQSKMNQATSSNPSDGLGQVAEQLNSYLLEHETDLESILQESSSDYTFYFAVPDFSLGLRSNTVRKAYVVPNTTSSTRPYLSFICGVIKFALSLYFAYYVWDHVVYELWKF